MEFTAFGHQNISAKHKTTLEFTKDDYVTPTGDCILGINADFEVPAYDLGKIRIILKGDCHEETITAQYNPNFKNPREMVIRKSGFIDDRTFATKADKAAVDINKDLVKHLRKPKNSVTIKVSSI